MGSAFFKMRRAIWSRSGLFIFDINTTENALQMMADFTLRAISRSFNVPTLCL